MASLSDQISTFTIQELQTLAEWLTAIENLLFVHGCTRDDLYCICQDSHRIVEDRLLFLLHDNNEVFSDRTSEEFLPPDQAESEQEPTFLCPSCHEFVPLSYMDHEMCLSCYKDMNNLSFFEEIQENFSLF